MFVYLKKICRNAPFFLMVISFFVFSYFDIVTKLYMKFGEKAFPFLLKISKKFLENYQQQNNFFSKNITRRDNMDAFLQFLGHFSCRSPTNDNFSNLQFRI